MVNVGVGMVMAVGFVSRMMVARGPNAEEGRRCCSNCGRVSCGTARGCVASKVRPQLQAVHSLHFNPRHFPPIHEDGLVGAAPTTMSRTVSVACMHPMDGFEVGLQLTQAQVRAGASREQAVEGLDSMCLLVPGKVIRTSKPMPTFVAGVRLAVGV